MAKTLTQYPGTLAYMPPEAMDERHSYGPSLDIFSFGLSWPVPALRSYSSLEGRATTALLNYQVLQQTSSNLNASFQLCNLYFKHK